MSPRSRLKKLLHLDTDKHATDDGHDGNRSLPESPHSGSTTRSLRYEATSPGRAPRIGHRPLSSVGYLPPSPFVKSDKSEAVKDSAAKSGPDVPVPNALDVHIPDSRLRDSQSFSSETSSSAPPAAVVAATSSAPLQVSASATPPATALGGSSPAPSTRDPAPNYSHVIPRRPVTNQDRGAVAQPIADGKNQHSLSSSHRDIAVLSDQQQPAQQRDYLVHDAAEAPSLEGVVDISNTQDTTIYEKWAPAVTHETRHTHTHHIREEQVTREIHNHTYIHRILPVRDVEVLPARHFIPADDKGNLVEVAEEQLPESARYGHGWFVAETTSGGPVDLPRDFTAREFAGTEGDFKAYVGEDGVPRTETTWVHPPEIDQSGRLAGVTAPFHFGSENPADDGLRLKSSYSDGKVVAVTEELARQRGDLAESMQKLDLGGDGEDKAKVKSEAFM